MKHRIRSSIRSRFVGTLVHMFVYGSLLLYSICWVNMMALNLIILKRKKNCWLNAFQKLLSLSTGNATNNFFVNFRIWYIELVVIEILSILPSMLPMYTCKGQFQGNNNGNYVTVAVSCCPGNSCLVQQDNRTFYIKSCIDQVTCPRAFWPDSNLIIPVQFTCHYLFVSYLVIMF